MALGFGRHIRFVDPRNLAQMGLQGVIGGTFSTVAAAWSKTSFGITLLRITDGKFKLFVWFVIVSTNVAMGLSALVAWIQCQPVAKSWDWSLPGSCWDPSVSAVYGVFAGVYSGLMDWALALLPWRLIWGLQMERREKIGVGVAMSLGLL